MIIYQDGHLSTENNKMKNLWTSLITWVVITIGKVHWGYKNGLTNAELDEVRKLLTPHYYIILTHRKNHLSTFFVGLASWLLTRKWSY